MEAGNERPAQSESLLRRAEQAIQRTFDDLQLYRYFSEMRRGTHEPVSSRPSIAIFGAGAAVEIAPLTDHLQQHGIEKPRIIAFDRNPVGKN